MEGSELLTAFIHGFTCKMFDHPNEGDMDSRTICRLVFWFVFECKVTSTLR